MRKFSNLFIRGMISLSLSVVFGLVAFITTQALTPSELNFERNYPPGSYLMHSISLDDFLVGSMMDTIYLNAVSGDSMLGTLHNKDTFLINMQAYINHSPQHGDVISFKSIRNGVEIRLIKRIIAGPGDELVFDSGQVYLNGTLLIEDYTMGTTYYPSRGIPKCIVVEEGHYFVMGDNRENSLDSRSFGTIKEEDIIGKSECILSPVDHQKKL